MTVNRSLHLLLVIHLLIVALDVHALAEEAGRFRMEGVVTIEGTDQAIAGAAVKVLIESEQDSERRVISSQTDAQGRYSISLPAGHAVAWHLEPPPGYTPLKSSVYEPFATSASEPVFKRDYQVRKGVAWNIVVRRKDDRNAPEPNVHVTYLQQRDSEFFHGMCEIQPKQMSVLTLPDVGGEFTLTCGDREQSLAAPENMKLTAEKGFRPDQVAAVRQSENGGFELQDESGRTATLHGVQAEVTKKAATLVIDVKPNEQLRRVALVGRVADAAGKPVGGAKIEAAMHFDAASSMTQHATTSAASGDFRLILPLAQPSVQVSLVATKAGHAGLDTKPQRISDFAAAEVRFGTLKLPRSVSLPIRVVGPTGEPLVGALIEPGGSYAARARISRTGSQGMCMLTDVAAGVEFVSARFGALANSTKVLLVDGENELLVLKLKPLPTPSDSPIESPHASLAVGAEAPEWTIAEWTDGQGRKLSDFRGKIVVLDFWGTWCGPCIGAIPAMKELHKRYENRDVVFIGIHTAGSDMALVKRLLKQQQWDIAVGLDKGDDINSGATVQSYGIRGFPTVVVVDRLGKVAFNSGIELTDPQAPIKLFETLAREIGLSWPIDKDADQEEIGKRMTKLQAALFGREIDRALAIPAK